MLKKTTDMLSGIKLELVLCLLMLLPSLTFAQECFNIEPGSGSPGNQLAVVVHGNNTHFKDSITWAHFDNPGIDVVNTSVVDNNTALVVINISDNATPGTDNVTLTTGQEKVVCENGFGVFEPITISAGYGAGLPGTDNNSVAVSIDNPNDVISGVMPVQVKICAAGDFLTLTGEKCVTTSRTSDYRCITLDDNETGCTPVLLYPKTVQPVIEAGTGPIFFLKYGVSGEAPLGQCADLTLEDVIINDESGSPLPDDETASVDGVFCFVPPPSCLGISRETGWQGDQNILITVTGSNSSFDNETTMVSFDNNGITVTDISVLDNDTVNVFIDIADNASKGVRDITVTTNQEAVTCSNIFEVLEPVKATIGSSAGYRGSRLNQVEVSLKNQDDNLKNIKMDICDVDDFLTCTECETTERTSGFACNTSTHDQDPEVPEECVRVNLQGGIIETGEGPVFSLNCALSGDAPAGECRKINVEDVEISDNNTQFLKAVSTPGEFCFDNCTVPADCNEGLWCFDNETCVEGSCQSMEKCPDDGMFCNGMEYCDEDNDECRVSEEPCAFCYPLEWGACSCNTETKVCSGCNVDDDCDAVCNPGWDAQHCDGADNCPSLYNPSQADTDNDTIGDACDNCPDVENFEQDDFDNDGTGNVCDETPFGSSSGGESSGTEGSTGGSESPGGSPAAPPPAPEPDPECVYKSDCDNRNFCDGEEICVSGRCQQGTSPCGLDETCDENSDICIPGMPGPESECSSDSDCNDGKFCNGEEKCVNEKCVDGKTPCGLEEVCMEEMDECWGLQKTAALSIQRELLRPALRESRCTWLVLRSKGGDNFDNSLSTITIDGPDENSSGVVLSAERETFKAFGFILVPLCIEKEATKGQWIIEVQTSIIAAENPFVEKIKAVFEVN